MDFFATFLDPVSTGSMAIDKPFKGAKCAPLGYNFYRVGEKIGARWLPFLLFLIYDLWG